MYLIDFTEVCCRMTDLKVRAVVRVWKSKRGMKETCNGELWYSQGGGDFEGDFFCPWSVNMLAVGFWRSPEERS